MEKSTTPLGIGARRQRSISPRPSWSKRATTISLGRNSIPTPGGSGSRSHRLTRLSLLIPNRFYEGDFVDLFEGGQTGERLRERRLAQEDHALLLGGALDVGAGTPVNEHLPDMVGEVQER